MTTKYEYMKDYYKFVNWRFVSANKWVSSHGSSFRSTYTTHRRGLWVMMDNYHNSCFIYGLTVKEFLRVSESGDYTPFLDHYWDRCRVVNCGTCNGAGKLDWISRITGPPSFDKMRNNYVRDRSKIITSENNFLTDYIFAPTKIFKSERICKDCMGTGVYMNNSDINNLTIYNINDVNVEVNDANKMESSKKDR